MLKVTRDPDSGRIRRLQTNDVMFSYAYLTAPRPETDLKKGTYGADVIILDDETLEAIKEYIREIMEHAVDDVWEGKMSRKMFKSGDLPKLHLSKSSEGR